MRSPPSRRSTRPRLPRRLPVDGASPCDRFCILFVCTGNVCRSVIAERLMAAELRALPGDEAAQFRVASAGTAGLPGAPLHPHTATVLGRLGVSVDDFASRGLTPADIDAADLILSASGEHRDQVVAMRPRASRRAYLLREFARLAAFAAPPGAAAGLADRARHVVAEAARLRGRVPCAGPGEDEIADPLPTCEAFARCAGVIHAAVRDVVDTLKGGDRNWADPGPSGSRWPRSR